MYFVILLYPSRSFLRCFRNSIPKLSLHQVELRCSFLRPEHERWFLVHCVSDEVRHYKEPYFTIIRLLSCSTQLARFYCTHISSVPSSRIFSEGIHKSARNNYEAPLHFLKYSPSICNIASNICTSLKHTNMLYSHVTFNWLGCTQPLPWTNYSYRATE